MRHNFFTIRIINLWNNLPESIISVDSVSLFKKKLDDHWNQIKYGHNQRPEPINYIMFNIIVCPLNNNKYISGTTQRSSCYGLLLCTCIN